jgi:hypothetical protein
VPWHPVGSARACVLVRSGHADWAAAPLQVTKRMNYAMFQDALTSCAGAQGVDADVLMEAVANCEGPITRGTHADTVRLHEMEISTGARNRHRSEPHREPQFMRDGRPVWQET